MSRFVLPGANPGLLVIGNIDIVARTNVMVVNKDGSISSVRSMSFFRWTDPLKHPGDPDAKLGHLRIPPTVRARHEHVEVLVPTVIPKNGKWIEIGDAGARDRALSTGLHLGIFDTAAHATAYANKLHLQQAAAGQRIKSMLKRRKRIRG